MDTTTISSIINTLTSIAQSYKVPTYAKFLNNDNDEIDREYIRDLPSYSLHLKVFKSDIRSMTINGECTPLKLMRGITLLIPFKNRKYISGSLYCRSVLLIPDTLDDFVYDWDTLPTLKSYRR